MSAEGLTAITSKVTVASVPAPWPPPFREVACERNLTFTYQRRDDKSTYWQIVSVVAGDIAEGRCYRSGALVDILRRFRHW